MLFKFLFIFLFFSFSAMSCEKPSMPSESIWNNWLVDVQIEALNNGISKKTLDKY